MAPDCVLDVLNDLLLLLDFLLLFLLQLLLMVILLILIFALVLQIEVPDGADSKFEMLLCRLVLLILELSGNLLEFLDLLIVEKCVESWMKAVGAVVVALLQLFVLAEGLLAIIVDAVEVVIIIQVGPLPAILGLW